MRRQYFSRFYFSIVPWALGVILYALVLAFPSSNVTPVFIWLYALIFTLLGVYLIYQGYKWVETRLRPTDSKLSDTILAVSVLLGFAMLGFFGILTQTLGWAAAFVAPLYGGWNFYRYKKTV